LARLLKDWMKAYGVYTSKSDSPEIFHIWCGLGAIAGAAQRKIWMHNAYFDVYPNMYIVLVSPPGRGKKTSALRTAKNILKEIEPKVNFVSESGSMEAIVGAMSRIVNKEHQSMTLFSMELGSIINTSANVMVDWLTDIYDCNPDWSRQTVKHDLQTITRPYLNIMTGTTPRWLSERMGTIALEGGLIARSLLIYSEELLANNPWPGMESEEDEGILVGIKDKLAHDLSTIGQLQGEFKFEGGSEGEAYQWYDHWYRTVEERYPEMPDPRTAGYYDRKHIHLLKIAMCLSLSYKDELILTLGDLQRALSFLDGTEAGIRLALNAVGRNERSIETDQILFQIKKRGTMTYKELLIENYVNLRDGQRGLDEALGELVVMQRVRRDGYNFTYLPNGRPI